MLSYCCSVKAPVFATFAKRFQSTSFSKSFTDKYHECLCQFAPPFYFCSLFVGRKKTMENVHYERRRLLVAVLNTYFSKVMKFAYLFTSSYFSSFLLIEDYDQGAL